MKHDSAWLVSGLGAFALLTASAPPAFACGACECAQVSELVSLVRGVPLNLDLMLSAHSGELMPPRLERVSDQSLIATAERMGAASGLWRLKPTAELAPNTEYRIMRTAGAVSQFTTGTSRDESAPTFEGVSTSPGGNGALCSPSVGAGLTLSGVADAGDNPIWVEFEVQLPQGATNIFSNYVYGNSLRLGQTTMGCFGSNELAGITAGQSYSTRVRVHDVAGHASDWRTVFVSMAADVPGGCGGMDLAPPQGGATGGAATGGAATGGAATGLPAAASAGTSTVLPADGASPAGASEASCSMKLAERGNGGFGVWGVLGTALWALFSRRARDRV